ncbi:MAG: DUF4443 domain-containing protein [Nitrososphaeria archaeon]
MELVDTLRALFILESKSMGRKTLSKKLGVGEGYIRKIIRKLEERKYIRTSRMGTSLSDKGRELLNELRNAIRPLGRIQLAEHKGAFGIVVRKAADKVVKGLEERDEAIRYGAAGAMILTYQNDKLWFPSLDCVTDKYPEIDSSVRRAAGELHEGDVVIVAWGDNEIDSERGAYAAALLLLEKAKAKIRI